MTTKEKVLKLIDESGKDDKVILKEAGFTSTSTISDWRHKPSSISTDALIKIANHFKVSLDWLCGLTDDPTPKQKKPSDYAEGSERNQQLMSDILSKLKKLPDDKLTTLNDFIDKFTQGK